MRNLDCMPIAWFDSIPAPTGQAISIAVPLVRGRQNVKGQEIEVQRQRRGSGKFVGWLAAYIASGRGQAGGYWRGSRIENIPYIVFHSLD